MNDIKIESNLNKVHLNKTSNLLTVSLLVFLVAFSSLTALDSFRNLYFVGLIGGAFIVIILIKKYHLWPSITLVIMTSVMLFDVEVKILAGIKLIIFLLVVAIFAGLKPSPNNNNYQLTSNRTLFVFSALGVIALARGLLLGYDISKILTSVWVLLQVSVYYVLTKKTITKEKELKENLKVLVPFGIGISIYSLTYSGRFVIGSAAIGGYISHILIIPILYKLLFETSKIKIFGLTTVILILVGDLVLSGSRRFLIPVIISLLPFLITKASLKRLMILSFFCIALSLVLVTFFLEEIPKLAIFLDSTYRGIGYRFSETFIGLDYVLQNNVLFGIGFGGQTDVMRIGTKGVFAAGPSFHNYYLTILFNLGIVGLICFAFFIIKVITDHSKQIIEQIKNGRFEVAYFSILLFFVGWLVSAFFDSPRDGHWLLGFLPAILDGYKRPDFKE